MTASLTHHKVKTKRAQSCLYVVIVQRSQCSTPESHTGFVCVNRLVATILPQCLFILDAVHAIFNHEVEQGLTSHQTHYRSYRGWVFMGQMTKPTVSKEDRVLRIRLQSHQVHPTVLTIIQQQHQTIHTFTEINLRTAR